MSDAETGRLEKIWIKRVRRGPMDEVERARLVTGRGLEGNANQGTKRQVTILSADAWEAAARQLGRDVDPRVRRANLFVRGLDLAQSRGRILRIGGCHLRIYGETRPCRLMNDQIPGLEQALDPDWRGGVFGQVLDDGEIKVGDPVTWETEGGAGETSKAQEL